MSTEPPLHLPERLSDDAVVLDAYVIADAEAHWAGAGFARDGTVVDEGEADGSPITRLRFSWTPAR